MNRAAWIVLVMVGMLVVPAVVTLRTVEVPGTLDIPSQDPTPLGYTWSLTLFLFPLTIIAWWFLRHPRLQWQRKAYWTTIAVLTPLGFVLDLLFGRTFFTFPNEGAVLGISIPGVGGSLPLEEFVFYLSGFMFVLLFYIWNDEYWLQAYNVPDYSAEAATAGPILRFDPISVVVGVVLVAGAFVYKGFFSEATEGWPAYFTFLVVAAIVPSAGLFRSTRPFVNWRAFSMTLFFVVLVSLLWEATLAVPYGWWGYQERMMIGIFVGAWSELPVEEPCLWLMVTVTTVIVFEAVKIWRAKNCGLRDALFGIPDTD